MNIIFADMNIPASINKSLFLAGPSPRDKETRDWRIDAISYLEKINYDGTVFVPIPKNKFYGQDDDQSWTYDNQINWECMCREVSDIIVFWVPRDIKGKMPAFTTNVEFGEDLHSGKIIYGRPDDAEKCRYLDKRTEDLSLPVFNDLEKLLDYSLSKIGDGANRVNGEVFVPLFIWQTEQFQNWYSNLKKAGNRLDKAKLLSHTKYKNGNVFSFTLWVKVWISSETRYKENEFIFSRTDISSVAAYYHDQETVKVLLVKEFRSAVSNEDGFVYELPGGSSPTPGEDPLSNAQHELQEETGILIEDKNRFRHVGTRQLASTMLTHQAQLYAVELNEKEYNQALFNYKNKIYFGVEDESERTYIEIVSLNEIKKSLIDYSTLGMIYEAVYLKF